MTAYFISGLGADERIFERLKLPDDISIKHVKWIEPLPKEKLDAYSRRLSSQIDTSEDFVLIGMSLGGMIAIELNKIIHPKKTIIISAVSTTSEFPFLFRFINFFKLHKIIPAQLFKTPNPFAYWFFSTKTQEEKILLRSFMKNVSKTYLKWSINEVLNWKNNRRSSNLIHIHGTADRIFPHAKTNATIKIKNGGHLMVHDQAEEISRVLLKILEEK